MKNEQTIKSILEAIEKSVDKDIQASRPTLKENAIVDLIHQFAQAWNDVSPIVDEFGNQGNMTHGEAFRITVSTILGFGGSMALALTWDKVKAAIMKAPAKIKAIAQALKGIRTAKSEDDVKAVMQQFGASKTAVFEARKYAMSQLFEATKADKGGAKQDNKITGKKPADKQEGADAEDWKEVDADTEEAFGSKPTEKKPQDASKASFKAVAGGESKAKKIDTDPTFSKVKGGEVKKK